jgi:hypothetical protein
MQLQQQILRFAKDDKVIGSGFVKGESYWELELGWRRAVGTKALLNVDGAPVR